MSVSSKFRCFLLCVSLVVPFLCQSQNSRSLTLQGMVVDQSGAPLPGAEVKALDASGRPVTVTSGPRGEFKLTLAAGRYSLKISKDSFLENTREIEIPVGNDHLEQVSLRVAPVSTAVTVTASEGYVTPIISSATKTLTPLRDVPQSITVVTQEQIKDQMMTSVGDLVRYVPGITATQGENNRDQLNIRGNSTSADFFLNGARDDVQYYRDFYNLDRVEALKGPNAMIFGRGGAGGVINRVTKEAGFTPLREITLNGGSFADRRAAIDLDQPLNDVFAFRFNGMYDNSDSFRNFVGLERYGINPTMTIQPGMKTKFTVSFENFRDTRTADRGVPSFAGRPINIPDETFFGNPDLSAVKAYVNLGTISFDQQLGRVGIKNRTLIGDYDRFYQNFVPGAVTSDQLRDSLSSYNNATHRRNLFNQTDVVFGFSTGRIHHTLVTGAEFGRQWTDNFRNTGFFNNTATTLLVPISAPTISTPMTFRQSATDADNHLDTNVAATYVQDQIDLTHRVQLLGGVRVDRFDLQYHNNRNGDNLGRTDNLVSPRLGIVVKPVASMSVYGSYSVSYLPSSGDQFSSLTTITQQVKPERFNNYEAGVKWDVTRYLSLTTAVFRLDRTNTRSTDPNDPTRIIQTGSQRTNGYEAGVTGSITRAWKIVGGYSYQDAFVSSATASAVAGAQVGQVPHHTFSLWNNYQIHRRVGAGLGLLNRSDMFAAIDNTVTLPGYIRADAAVYFSLTEKVRFQANIENLAGTRYTLNADSNTNISPGSPRAVRVGLNARF